MYSLLYAGAQGKMSTSSTLKGVFALHPAAHRSQLTLKEKASKLAFLSLLILGMFLPSLLSAQICASMPAWVDPCPSSGVGCIPVGGNSIANPLTVTDIHLQGNYNITSNTTWTGLNIRIAAGSTITITAGFTLTIQNCYIAIDPNGGQIQQFFLSGVNAQLFIDNSCLQDFINGVNNLNGRNMVISNSDFYNNDRHIRIANFGGVHPAQIYGNSFRNLTSNLGSIEAILVLSGTNAGAIVKIGDAAQGVNTFTNTLTIPKTAISLSNASAEVNNGLIDGFTLNGILGNVTSGSSPRTLIVGSTSPITIKNSRIGIQLQNLFSAQIFGSTFTDITNDGITSTNGTGNQNVTGNIFSNVGRLLNGNSVIEFWNPIDNQDLWVIGNSIVNPNIAGGYDFGRGIYLSNAVYTTQVRVRVNDNIVNDKRIGIEIDNFFGETNIGQVYRNKINNVPFFTNPAIITAGIRIRNCRRFEIWQNEVKLPSTSFLTNFNKYPIGIHSFGNTTHGELDYTCNFTSNMQGHIEIEGDHLIRIGGNKMDGLGMRGISFNNIGLFPAVSGNQGSIAQANDNQWLLGNTIISRRYYYNTSALPPFRWYWNITAGPTYNPFPVTELVSGLDVQHPQFTTSTPFINCNTPSPLREGEGGGEGSRVANGDTLEFGIYTDTTSVEYQSLSASGKWMIDEMLINKCFENQDFSDEYFELLLGSNGRLSQSKQYLVYQISKAIQAGDSSTANSLFSQFVPENEIESNYFGAYGIYLNTFFAGIYELDSIQWNTLLSIAMNCPDEGGNGVNTARLMLAKLDYEIVDTFCTTNSINDSRMANLSQPSNLGINIYPNPINDQFNVSLTSELGTVHLELINSLGATVLHDWVGGTKTISMSEFPSGIYLLKMTDLNNSLIFNSKIIKL